MLQKFKSLSLLKKTLIIFGLVIMFFFLIYWYGLDAPNEVRSPRIYSHSVFSNNRIDF